MKQRPPKHTQKVAQNLESRKELELELACWNQSSLGAALPHKKKWKGGLTCSISNQQGTAQTRGCPTAPHTKMGSRESLECREHNGEVGFSNGDESWLIWWREKQGRRGIGSAGSPCNSLSLGKRMERRDGRWGLYKVIIMGPTT